MDTGAIAKQFGVSSVFGMCVGVAAKKLTKDAMYGVGLGVIGLQTLSHLGYIKIDWQRVEDDITKQVDQDGDGKLTYSDAKIIFKKFLKMMKTGMPSAGGFVTGVYLGIKLF